MQLELAALPAHDERARVLCDAGAVDRVDDLERVLHHDTLRHVQEGAAGPERRVRGLQLVAVDRQALGIPAPGQLWMIAKGLLERAQDHAARPLARGRARHGRPTRRAARAVRRGLGRGAYVPRSRAQCLARMSCVEPPARRGRGSAGSSSRTPSAARPGARRSHTSSALPRAAARACARCPPRRRPARGRGSPRGGGPA